MIDIQLGEEGSLLGNINEWMMLDMGAETVTLRNILEADRRIRGIVNRTPTYRSMAFSKTVGAEVFAKLECFQPVGVFKIRGAANKILKPL